MDDPLHTPASIVRRFGVHPAHELGLDLLLDRDLGRWLVAACLFAGRGGESTALVGHRALETAGLATPHAIAEAGPEPIAAALETAGLRDAAPTAHKLWRASQAVLQRYAGSLDALAASADDLEDLARRIAGLSPGIGAATVARFLRPLRDRWPQAAEVPLLPAARAAAEHLGWIRPGADLEGEPGALRAALREADDAPDLADVEAALGRIGSRSCLRERTDRCPLGEDCPLRELR